MNHEQPRCAKLLVAVESKYVGLDVGRAHKAGKKVKVQRSATEPGQFIIWFGRTEIARISALELAQTIEYIDGRAEP
ncbi:hypothetical protein ACFSHT_40675 [Paraburkholderia silviterrae]|uniref:Uncharacterized protein n=1 Tax=Paraburkholderia silviterrae TaxID=2528715 RepID=A0A4R5M1G3_9BURK|nr:hypothetical protein [Paraburkholderia silviterrae]TDG19146.1 hypothetical protein EYW47_31975 [Paraburkholderia silviterrae]